MRWNDVTAEAVATVDPTRRLARVTAGATGRSAPIPGLADFAAILLAAEQVGAAAAAWN